jgi:hypothetical protein
MQQVAKLTMWPDPFLVTQKMTGFYHVLLFGSLRGVSLPRARCRPNSIKWRDVNANSRLHSTVLTNGSTVNLLSSIDISLTLESCCVTAHRALEHCRLLYSLCVSVIRWCEKSVAERPDLLSFEVVTERNGDRRHVRRVLKVNSMITLVSATDDPILGLDLPPTWRFKQLRQRAQPCM